MLSVDIYVELWIYELWAALTVTVTAGERPFVTNVQLPKWTVMEGKSTVQVLLRFQSTCVLFQQNQILPLWHGLKKMNTTG